MSRNNIKKTNFGLTLIWAGLVLILAAGCANVGVDPGPNPARLEISLKAQLDKAMVHTALSNAWLTPPIRLPGGWHEVNGPYWDWGIYLRRDDGSLEPLRLASGGPTKNLRAYDLDQTAVFLAPPGPQPLRLIVQAYMEHKWYDDAGENWEPVPIKSFEQNLNLDFRAGGTLRLKRQLNFTEKAGK